MKAGKSVYEVGARIKIRELNGEDSTLSGLVGTLTHPFGCYCCQGVGVWLDNGGACNLDLEDFDVIG
jgi:hypothetical protein